MHMVKVCSRDSPLPSEAYLKISGGIFHDCAVHDIDMASWVLGEYPVEVFTYAYAFRQFIADMNDVDTVSISMKFPSGAIGQIDLSRLAVSLINQFYNYCYLKRELILKRTDFGE